MRKIKMLNRISIDGYFASLNETSFGMDWFIHDPEVDTAAHVIGGKMDTLILGRKTYRLFEHFWVPILNDPHAPVHMKATAEELTAMTKVVFTHTVSETAWDNTRICKENPVEAARQMKQEPGSDLLVLGSGSIVQQLADAGLIDEYIFIVTPIVAGEGKPLFPAMNQQQLLLREARTFKSGNVVLHYTVKK